MEVKPAAAFDAERFVEQVFQCLDLPAFRRCIGVEAHVWRGVTVEMLENRGRVRDDVAAVDQHRHAGVAADPVSFWIMETREMALLVIRQAEPLKRPARFLAVMTYRNRDQAHACHDSSPRFAQDWHAQARPGLGED